jgi:hypothetical protein
MLDNQWIQFGAVPAVLAFAAVGLIRLVAGSTIGPKIASSGTGIAVLITLAVDQDPATLLDDPLLLVMIGLVVAGLTADLLFQGVRPLMRTLVIAAPLLALLWMANPQIGGPLSLETALFGACFVAIAVILFSFSDFEPTNMTPVVLLAMAALGIGLVLLIAGERFGAGVSLSASAAVAAFFVWNWPQQRFAAGGGLMIGIAALVLLFAAAAVIGGAANRLSIAMPILVFFADKVFRLPAFTSRAGRAIVPFVLAAVSGIVVLAAVAAAMLTTV